MKKDNLKIAEDLTEGLLKLIGVEAKAEVQEDKENGVIKIQIETPEPGILIGYHGETLSAFQVVLGIMISRKLGEWIRVAVNIGDYREKREEVLRQMALTAAQKAKFSGEPVVLPELSASERRIIHLVLVDHPDAISQSEGEGENRRLVVKPKKL